MPCPLSERFGRILILELLSQLDGSQLECRESISNRIGHIRMVHRGIRQAFPMRFDDPGGNSDDGGIGRHIFQHH